MEAKIKFGQDMTQEEKARFISQLEDFIEGTHWGNFNIVIDYED